MKSRILFAIGITAFAVTCFAQQGPPPREVILTKRIFLGLLPKVSKELSITSDQRTKILDVFGDSLQMEGDRVRLRLTGNQSVADMEEEAIKILNAGQQKRLEEIWIQHIGGVALADATIAKKVGLSANQKATADKLVDEAGSAVLDHMSEGPSPDAAKKIGEIRTKCGKKIEALLNEAQLKNFANLKGKPFDLNSKG